MTNENKLTKREETLPEETRDETRVSPLVDIYENEDGILLLADMPGVDKDALNVKIDKDVLSIEGKPHLAEGKGLVRCEAEPCTYARSFSLPQTIDSDKISAKLERGVLTLHLPKRESVKPRQIQVTTG